ncbi:fimbrillin family protein [Bacteroides intestinalis]|uniref:Fimbrillin family protein n=1 Tax=Bacteroides intestinalis TaxID=329854 RepID=A0A414L4F2_9BACE|nr:fimbrillin family protein [Bacteroides intestinalis]RHE89522.1 fimbrillin family protein [Bacteroides intestinalis]
MKKQILNILPYIASGFLLLASGCTDEQSAIPVASGTPLTITAEIGTSASPSSTDRLGDAAPANDYDLSTFRTGDQISVTCTRNSALLASSGYTLNAAGSWKALTGSELGFLPAVTYRASFPVGYDGIQASQEKKADFLKSNYLRTPEVPVSGAEVKFTDTNAFNHENAKLTLKFTGVNTLPVFSRMTVQAIGLRTGSSTATESINMLRPVDSEYIWCAVIYPRAKNTEISITITDAYGLTYKATVKCGMAKGTSYTYTLNLQNNILVPVGQAEIKDWTVSSRHNGDFDPSI